MIYKEFAPSPGLARYIKCYWTLESEEGPAISAKEKVFPDGCAELIFHYGDLFRKYESDKKFHLQERCFIHGQLKKYIELEATGRVGIFSARFFPGGLQPFIERAVSGLTGGTLAVRDAWPEGTKLETEMLACGSTAARIGLLENFLLAQLALQRHDTAMVEHFVNVILRTEGNVSIDELAAQAKVGKRQLERKFFPVVGLTPKMLARITRFNKALKLIEKKDFSSFTAVAHEGGFYDQAHFIKDFKEITGLNPKRYFAENLELVKFFSLDK